VVPTKQMTPSSFLRRVPLDARFCENDEADKWVPSVRSVPLAGHILLHSAQTGEKLKKGEHQNVSLPEGRT
jgi:hypothetical protein